MLPTVIALALLAPASIQLDQTSNGLNIRVVGGAKGKVALFVSGQADVQLPAVLGSTTKVGNDLLFTPRFPLQAGRDYRVEYLDTEKITAVIRIPDASASRPTVVRMIYPSVDTLPANQLKLYLQFSAPMSRGVAYSHIHLLDDSGREVEHAFLELGEELWDSDQTRFTLLFDPGRIKRDLVPNVDDGTPLQPGRRYTIKIDSSWPDAKGSPLQEVWTSKFFVTAADRTAPDPKLWLLRSPNAGTRIPLAVNFPEPMDFGLLLRTLRIVDHTGREVPGSIAIENGETDWRFTPQKEWLAGDYRLQVDGSLEDLAGNRIGRLFEVDTRTAPEMANRPSGKSTSIAFSIAPRATE